MRLAVPALDLVLLLSARRAWADDEGCAPGVPLAVDGLGTAADDLARVGELAGAVAPSPRVIRGGGGTLRDALVQRGALGGVARRPAEGVAAPVAVGASMTL